MAPREVYVHGKWGIPSATIDWCEENYAVTHYIAEFWNTVSNLVMIIPPFVTILIIIKQRFENRFLLCHLGVLSVGVGSWCFHMTLLYSMQLLDELPMIWGTAFLVYSFIEVDSPPNSHNKPLEVILLLYCLVVTIIYMTTNNTVFHEIAYGLMVACMVFASVRMLLTMECSKSLFITAFIFYMVGFLLWNIDNVYCGKLSYIRKDIAGMLGPLSEMHAWWHIGAGLGTYLSIIFVTHTRYTHLKKNPKFKVWLGFWPYVTLEETAGKKH
ncbi:hypothetical protein ACJMK2_019425 [Sinanodonta woodiana]|uniref:Alkaline ceramidase n=1 Tax=Sinanodonta woodiana TaxID=1069815 RepID=A0ABD3UJV0_SINWO